MIVQCWYQQSTIRELDCFKYLRFHHFLICIWGQQITHACHSLIVGERMPYQAEKAIVESQLM